LHLVENHRRRTRLTYHFDVSHSASARGMCRSLSAKRAPQVVVLSSCPSSEKPSDSVASRNECLRGWGGPGESWHTGWVHWLPRKEHKRCAPERAGQSYEANSRVS